MNTKQFVEDMNEHLIKPTEGEMEILQVLWKKGECTVREVFEELNKKDIGYTTILKIMQIMHEKGMVDRNTSAKTHIYKALLNKENTQQHFLNKMIDTVYNGSTARLVMQALGNKSASREEIDLIKEYLEKLEK
ncbi:BlaI/MecI/CopY family transcriptional regulator [Sphingobacterium pedocola]|nr:BlaI/MecI/CopY family transcriptional regulator [Sphingobacterium pedocola]